MQGISSPISLGLGFAGGVLFGVLGAKVVYICYRAGYALGRWEERRKRRKSSGCRISR